MLVLGFELKLQFGRVKDGVGIRDGATWSWGWNGMKLSQAVRSRSATAASRRSGVCDGLTDCAILPLISLWGRSAVVSNPNCVELRQWFCIVCSDSSTKTAEKPPEDFEITPTGKLWCLLILPRVSASHFLFICESPDATLSRPGCWNGREV